MLKIAVCIKQIPIIEDAGFDATTNTIKRDGPAVISAFDLRAIALAVDLKRGFGGEIAVVTMGPPQARTALVEALAMGADRVAHLQDRAFAGSDTLATARALTLWLKRERWDLILLGKYSLDAETGQVGPEIAELLGIAQITGVRKLEIAGDGMIRAERESDDGFDEVECHIPALLTCAERAAQPIRVKAQDREAAKTKPVETITAADLADDASRFGFAGSPTLVHELRFFETPKVNGSTIDAADPAQAAEKIIAALDEIGALHVHTPAREPLAGPLRTPARGRDVWVACETGLAGEIQRRSLELISQSARLAPVLGGAVVALLVQRSAAGQADLLGEYGADVVLEVESPALENYSAETMAAVAAELISQREPWGVLLSASERGRDWGPRLAAKLGLGLTGDAIGIELDEERHMVALKPAFGGNVVAPILSRTFPQMATVRAGVMELGAPIKSRTPTIEKITLPTGTPLSVVRASHSLLDQTIRPLEEADNVVGVGMGVGGREGIETVKKLAHVLDAGLCATRRVTDEGWVPRQLQVGLTGKAIAPQLYIAVAIRGAPNHMVGIKRANTVVAINSDPEAPIFERAALRLVADWAIMVPALTAAFRRRFAQGVRA